MTPPICGIVGSSGAGKTQLAEQLIPLLQDRGIAVGYLKHAPHGYDMDREHSDTWRVRQAPAAEVVIAGPDVLTHLLPRELARTCPGELVGRMHASELVLVEGFSHGAHPKIRVRSVGDEPRPVAGPVLLDLERRGDQWAPDDLRRAADVVEQLIDDAHGPAVHVVADGVDIAVTGFAATVVASGVRGITDALKGVEQPRTLTVKIRSGSTGSHGT